jgi:hypothetical protein
VSEKARQTSPSSSALQTVQPFHQDSDRARPELVGVVNGLLASVCPNLPIAMAPDDECAPLVSDVPTFIVEGELPMWSNGDWVDMLRIGLSRSTSMLFPALADGPLASAPRHASTSCGANSSPIRRRHWTWADASSRAKPSTS